MGKKIYVVVRCPSCHATKITLFRNTYTTCVRCGKNFKVAGNCLRVFDDLSKARNWKTELDKGNIIIA